MRIIQLLRSTPGKLFLVTWVIFSMSFATNIVREHYPAFSIVDDFSFEVDRYQGFHPDIFVHSDGHSYIGNNVAVSVLTALPLFVTDPFLDGLERATPAPEDDTFLAESYDTDKPNRVQFFELVRQERLTLRFGGVAFVTTALWMAPLTALFCVLLFHVMVKRGMEDKQAAWMALLFGLGSPIYFRTLHLNHNLFLMYAIFGAFVLLWFRPQGQAASWGRRFSAGALAGFCVAADYAGAVLLLVLYGYHIVARMKETTFKQAFSESLVFVLGSVPPVLYLLYSQWAMFGNPFLPGQYWMPDVNYTDEGWRGFSFPTPDLYWHNLFAPSYGMFIYGPLFLLALLPRRSAHPDSIVGPTERRFIWALTFAFLTFCAANQYSRMQFNSGFRYLVPLAPFLYLFVVENIRSWRHRGLMVFSGVMMLHAYVMATFREPIHTSWRLFFEEGIVLPWLRVLRMTTPADTPLVHSWWFPTLLVAATVAAAVWWWKLPQPIATTTVKHGA